MVTHRTWKRKINEICLVFIRSFKKFRHFTLWLFNSFLVLGTFLLLFLNFLNFFLNRWAALSFHSNKIFIVIVIVNNFSFYVFFRIYLLFRLPIIRIFRIMLLFFSNWSIRFVLIFIIVKFSHKVIVLNIKNWFLFFRFTTFFSWRALINE